MDNIKFTYDENISISKIEPLIDCDNINDYSENNYASTYFYNLYKPFLNKEILEELNRIFEYSNKTCKNKKYSNTINKDSWLNYKLSNNIIIKNVSESILKSKNILLNENNSISVNLIKNGKQTKLNFDNKQLYDNTIKTRPLFKTNSNINNTNENILYLHKECFCKNDFEYLYNLLNCLFSSNNTYYIKKCERCKRFFLTTLPNKRMCDRPRIICGKSTICCNASKIFYKSKEYKCMFRIIENHLKHFYDDNMTYSTYINNIRSEFSKIKEKCISEDKYDYANECIEETKKLINEDMSKYL